MILRGSVTSTELSLSLLSYLDHNLSLLRDPSNSLIKSIKHSSHLALSGSDVNAAERTTVPGDWSRKQGRLQKI